MINEASPATAKRVAGFLQSPIASHVPVRAFATITILPRYGSTMKTVLLAVAAAIATAMVLCGCAGHGGRRGASSEAHQVTQYQWGHPISFAEMSFDFHSVREAGDAGGNLLIIDLTLTNRRGAAMAPDSQPVFRLVDDAGGLHEPGAAQTATLNQGQPGRLQPGMAMSPNTPWREEIAFEVSRGHYRLVTVVPDHSQGGFAADILSKGPYFYLALNP